MSEPRDNFDPQLKKQFARIVISLFAALIFLIVNTVLGVILDLGFEDNPRIPLWAHILFYIWLLFSLFILYRFLSRLWRD